MIVDLRKLYPGPLVFSQQSKLINQHSSKRFSRARGKEVRREDEQRHSVASATPPYPVLDTADRCLELAPYILVRSFEMSGAVEYRAAGQAFLSNRLIQMRKTAPMIATMMVPIKPPA